jgi:hypothetical protein
MEADSSNRPKLSSSYVLPVFSIDLAGDRKLGYGFTSADELEEINIGPGDKPRPTFVSKTQPMFKYSSWNQRTGEPISSIT